MPKASNEISNCFSSEQDFDLESMNQFDDEPDSSDAMQLSEAGML